MIYVIVSDNLTNYGYKTVTGNSEYKTCLLPKCARAKAALFNKKQFCLAGGQIN